jgi:hypothetical protein
MTSLITSDHPLPANARDALRALAGIIIPASDEYAVPGADDATIFADLLTTLAPQAALVHQALRELDAAAEGPFASLDRPQQIAAAERFRASRSPSVSLLVALVAQCYYRDDRVMRSLDMEPRPPFPLGFELEPGDWSLLDPVRARGRLYREP